MDTNNIPQRQYLTDSAIADIAINDLGLTLDEPEFAGELCPWGKYNDHDLSTETLKRYNTLMYMTYYLCLVQRGFDLAMELVERCGLLNCKISDTIHVTPDYINEYMHELFIEFMTLKCVDAECQLATHYQQLFKEYCLKHMDEWRLKWKIIDKIETYLKHI